MCFGLPVCGSEVQVGAQQPDAPRTRLEIVLRLEVGPARADVGIDAAVFRPGAEVLTGERDAAPAQACTIRHSVGDVVREAQLAKLRETGVLNEAARDAEQCVRDARRLFVRRRLDAAWQSL